MKHRLAGAAVLLGMAVIFIPMILKGPDTQFGPSDEIPPLPDQQFEDKLAVEAAKAPVVQVPLQSLQGTAAQLEDAAAESVAAPLDEDAQVVEPTPVPSTQPVPKSAPLAKSAPAPVAGGWVVQVGSFSQAGNANSLRDRLKAKGYAARVDTVREADSVSYRVRIGPEAARAAADRLRDKLLSAENLKGIVQTDP